MTEPLAADTEATKASPDALTGALEVDGDGIVLFADDQAHHLLGPGLVGRSVDEFASLQHALHRSRFAANPRVRSMFGRMIEARRTDGVVAKVHLGLLPLSQGRVAVAVRPSDQRVYDDIETNITALQEDLGFLTDAGRALEYFELINSRAPVLFAIADADGWTCVSERLASCLGWDRHELAEQRYEDIIHPEDLQATADTVHRAARLKEPGRVTNRYRVFGTDRWRALRWRWDPEDTNGLTLAIAEDLGEAQG